MRGVVVRARVLSRALQQASRGDRACASRAGATPGSEGKPPGGTGGRAGKAAAAVAVGAAGAAGALYAYGERLKAEAAEAQRRQEEEEEARRRSEREAEAARAAEEAAARRRAEEASALQREEEERAAAAALERERHERQKAEEEDEEGAAARRQAAEEQRRLEEERLRLEEEEQRRLEEERRQLEEERRRLEEEAARRAAVLEALEAAVARRDPAACREALDVARGAGVDPVACPEGRLAAALAEPAQLDARLLAVEQADRLAELRSEAPGIGAEDFVMAAAACASAADGEEPLRRKAGELAAALQRNCSIHLASLEARLVEAQGMLRERCSVRVESALERLASDSRLAEAARRSSLQQEAGLRAGEGVADRVARVRSEAAAEREALCEDVAGRTSGQLAAEREALAKRLDNLGVPVGSLEELLSSGESLQRRSQASSALTRALLALEAALAAGRSPAKELEALLEAGKACREFLPTGLAPAAAAGAAGVVATKEQLRRDFGERLPQMAGSALAPPAGGGLLSHLCAHVAGRALASLYDFRAAADLGADRAPGAEAAQWNLTLLATASELVEVGDFAGALEALEQLTGECRECARAAWGGEARRTLLLQQAARAAQAEARCLNASLR